MNPVENHGDGMNISGSRRGTSGATTGDPAAIDAMTRESQRGKRGAALPSAGDSSFATRRGKGGWARFGRGWNEWRRGNRPHPMGLPKVGLVDWIEAIRGILFFGILAAVLWLEWVAIKAIAIYVSTFF